MYIRVSGVRLDSLQPSDTQSSLLHEIIESKPLDSPPATHKYFFRFYKDYGLYNR
ncbi:hypothetical protein [uncultured Helicobacter sp.]|uniref:hypothetical protein n=1 Tax=uncultured Helicobacter sp. TaxID=175537 RepID=UPI00374F4011